MSDVQKSRRAFFKDAAKVLTTVAVAPFVLNSIFTSQSSAEEKRRSKTPAAGPVMVDPNDGMAKPLKYTEDHNKAPESKGNKCATCSLFKPSAESNNGKKIGSCTLFQGKHVYTEAWCASWNKKA